MIDAGANVGDMIHRRADPAGQHRYRALDAVAQTGRLNETRAPHRPAQHRHRIGVVKQNCVRTKFFHVRHDADHHRNRPQRTEHATDTARVADVGIDAVFFGNQNVVLPHTHVAGQNRAQHRIRALQRLAPVHRRHDTRRILAAVNNALHRTFREIESFTIHVHQHQCGIFQQRIRQDVAHQATRKSQTTGTDKCNFCHNFLLAPKNEGRLLPKNRT